VRRSQRLQSHIEALDPEQVQQPSPITQNNSIATADDEPFRQEGTASPPPSRTLVPNTPRSSSPAMDKFSQLSPPADTQPMSQFVLPNISSQVDDEEAEGVWGYLVPLDNKVKNTLVMKDRTACPLPDFDGGFGTGHQKVGKRSAKQQEQAYEKSKEHRAASSGYLIGRHPECGKKASNHCKKSKNTV
jgi:serine/threonine-protein kinase CHEK2